MTEAIVLGEAAGETILGLLLKVTIVLAAGLAAVRILRDRTAAIRHGALAATIVAAVALPALTLALPGWNVPLFDRGGGDAITEVRPALRPMFPAVEPHSATTTRVADTGRESPMTLPPSRDAGSPWLPALLVVWAAGSALVLGRFGLDAARTSALLGDAVEVPEGAPERLATEIADHFGIRRPVRVRFSERLSVPVTWGILRPVVLLPLEAWEWEADRIRIVLLHELAHVRRVDCLWSGFAVVASALWWFHPLQWICRRRLRVEQERACDDVVLLAGVGPTTYASMLVAFARGMSHREESAIARAAIAMARRSTLRDRVETILASGSRRIRLDGRTAGLLAAVAAALLLPLAAVHLWGETAEARRTAELIGELKSADPAAREAAAWGLGALGAEDAVDPLIARLTDPVPQVRGVAGRALGKIGGPRAFAPLERLLDDPDPFVRELAILGLEDLPSSAVVGALVPMLADPEMGVRSVAVSVLSDLEGEAAVRALAAVAENDPDDHTRVMAIGGLAKGAADRSAAVPALVRLLDDVEVDIRGSAAWALAQIGDRQAVPGLVGRLGREDDAGARQEIVVALTGFAAESIAVDGLLAGVRDPDWNVRVSAAAALAGSDDPRSAAALVAALFDPVHQVRLESAWSLDAIEARR